MHWSFNTQPPEGGWFWPQASFHRLRCFNTQPPEGGWLLENLFCLLVYGSFNTQPPEGGWLAN